MSLHNTRASVLLAWVNSLKLGDAVTSLSQLQDCSLFLKIIVWGLLLLSRGVLQVTVFFSFCSSEVVMLLLYSASMSDKIPREWSTLEYSLQVREISCWVPWGIWSARQAPPQLPVSSWTAVLPVASGPFPFRCILLLPGSSSSSSSSSSSPMGEIMQTPQFQMRRLKKLLEAERENRDELEHELAESRKLIDEKGEGWVGWEEGRLPKQPAFKRLQSPCGGGAGWGPASPGISFIPFLKILLLACLLPG
uniref:Nuclear mitotic apparatus protein 1 N-terminal hook domain-containing protein n=1 Tax=Naja naja TaxID=35670 RepID=A0A8C6XND9_NAJNA